jgi:hypothetical protein
MLSAWNAMSRQKRVGWLILIISIGYGLYFFKVRLFASGPEITRKEWLHFILTFVGIALGTINIRMAEMRERNQKTLPLSGANRTAKK